MHTGERYCNAKTMGEELVIWQSSCTLLDTVEHNHKELTDFRKNNPTNKPQTQKTTHTKPTKQPPTNKKTANRLTPY